MDKKNSSVELDRNAFSRSNLVEMFLPGRTWSKCFSSVEHSGNIDSWSRVGQNISSLGRDFRNTPFFHGIIANLDPKLQTKVVQITLIAQN